VGFTVYGDGPAAQRIVQSLAAGELDAALVWGPQAAYFAQHAGTPLDLAIARPPAELSMPFEFAIAMGVRRGETALRDALDAAIARRRDDIDTILRDYAVPRTDTAAQAQETPR
ncbi:MAG TPA: transporter substrate-binding domain-containing protein, partial [Albitalea sp.]|nr:transporter substrate-binding domain-containing protein [Albitalea sp.]